MGTRGISAIAGAILVGMAFEPTVVSIKKCHFDPFACHSEQSEESCGYAQGRLREKSKISQS